MKAMCRLAVSPRVRGSGAAVEKLRKLQATSCALLSNATLKNQRAGLAAWLESRCRPGVSHRVLGFASMWDEASQKLKAMLTTASGSNSVGTANAFQTSGRPRMSKSCARSAACARWRLGRQEDGSLIREARWQPWISPPRFMAGTSHKFLIEALGRSLPVDLSAEGALGPWVQKQTDHCVITLCFDFASSNVAAFKYYVAVAEATTTNKPIMIHGERCATHCVHLVKAHCIAMSQVAGVLYSVNKLLVSNKVVDGLAKNLARRSPPPWSTGIPPPRPSTSCWQQCAILWRLMGASHGWRKAGRGRRAGSIRSNECASSAASTLTAERGCTT